MSDYMVTREFKYDGKTYARGDTWTPANGTHDAVMIAGQTHVIPADVAIAKGLKRRKAIVNATRGAITYAKESGINLKDIKGSGDNGRILKADVIEVTNE